MMDLFKAGFVTAWFALVGLVCYLFFHLGGVELSMTQDSMTGGDFIGLYLMTVFSASLYTTSLKDE